MSCGVAKNMLTAHRPLAVVFDVNETLVDLSSLSPLFDELRLPPHALEWWFATLLRDGFALAATGDIASFGTLAAVALDEILALTGASPSPDAVGAIMGAFAELPMHDDVAPAFERLTEVGIPIIALTNGNADATRGLLERAALTALVSDVYSVNAVAHWKPRLEAYQYVADETGVESSAIAMVAVHPWDLHGAAAAGFTTAWLNRGGRVFPEIFHQPHVHAPNLGDLVERLLALPR
jgi:2-haloacid dehalogenase